MTMTNLDLLKYALTGVDYEISSEESAKFINGAAVKNHLARLDALNHDRDVILTNLQDLRDCPDKVVVIL